MEGMRTAVMQVLRYSMFSLERKHTFVHEEPFKKRQSAPPADKSMIMHQSTDYAAYLYAKMSYYIFFRVTALIKGKH